MVLSLSLKFPDLSQWYGFLWCHCCLHASYSDGCIY